MSGVVAESCSTKANPTTPTEQDELDLEFRQSKYDWTLPGLGEPGEDCGKDQLPDGNAVCPNGDSVRYEPLRCRKVECPDCYKTEQLDRTFRIALEIEARAKKRGERPHAVTFSVPPNEARTWTYDRLNTSLFRRGYRRMEKLGIDGGYAIMHPWRVQEVRKDALRRRGYGSGGDKGGYWQGIRKDVLDLGDPRRYAKFAPHGHNIGFPERIEPHDGRDFVIKKYAELDTLRDVIQHTRYLLSHRGVRQGETGRSVRPWGAFHHASEEWNGAENELSEEEYHQLGRKIANILGMEWDRENGEPVHESECECPECGESVDNFLDLRELAAAGKSKVGEQPWLDTLPKERRVFFEELRETWRKMLADEDKQAVYVDDLDPPDSVKLWSSEATQ